MRDQVIDSLWPHLGVEAGAANLRKAAHHARQALGREDAVVLSGGQIAFMPTCQVDTDVDAFERMGKEALRSRSRAACVEAASAYTGILLPGSLYEEWTLARRDRVRSLHVELLRVSEAWGQLADVEPCDEQAHRELMRAALADGYRHAAIRWYGRLRTNLESELGMPPSAESQALYEECVAGLGRAAATLVGRQVELATAAAALRSAEDGELGALVVRGPAGIGKSALCRQIASSAARRGWLAVTVAAAAGADPYAPLVSVIEQLVSRDLTVLDGLPDKARSVLAELTALARARPREGGLTRHMVIGAIRRLLRAASDDGGVMLVIDDVHLADDATVEACAHLARSGSGFPFLVVLAYRAEGARPALTQGVAGLARAGRSVGIDVGPLDPDDVVVLASAGAPTKPDDKVLTQIVASAQGNPFVALELARTVVAGRPFAVSPSVWEAVTGRFLDLGDALGGVLCRLAVAGDDLDPVSVPALTGLSEPEAFTLLDAALAAGALIVSGARYRFGHELIRQALLRQIPPHQRIAMHREAARRLAAAGAAPGLVARQWLDGGRPHEAVGWLVVAARRAVKLGAFADALVHLDTALDYAPQHEDALCLRAEVLDALGDLRAPTAYAAAAQVVDEPASHDLRAKQALAELKLGDPPRALRTLEGSEPVSVEGRLAQALTLSGAAALGFADPELGTAKAAESRRLALASGDTAALVVASWAQAA
ncbi:MAG: AAA family ATPase, partial [Solirubrobacterales bacterium]|nr:AAA family ATPase [Solirubrobacterales bacterium]